MTLRLLFPGLDADEQTAVSDWLRERPGVVGVSWLDPSHSTRWLPSAVVTFADGPGIAGHAEAIAESASSRGACYASITGPDDVPAVIYDERVYA